MKTFSKILTPFFCMFLFVSSCDLLYEDEEEEIDYITVDVNLGVVTATIGGDIVPNTNIHIKIYKEGITISKKLTTGEDGSLYYSTGTYRMREGEVFTASAYLIDHPDVYASESLTYEVAKNNASDMGGNSKTYVWYPSLLLIVP
jgi:hypothetical protein